MVDILATDPAHMRRGAGKMLMKFGTDMADEVGLPCFLEGSPEGLGLYCASGFGAVGWIWLDLKKYQNTGEQTGQGDQKQERIEGVGGGWFSHAVMVRQYQSGKRTSVSD
jgi:hypothetical protein